MTGKNDRRTLMMLQAPKLTERLMHFSGLSSLGTQFPEEQSEVGVMRFPN